MRILPGQPEPLGATPDRGGTNFALRSEQADRVELCLFDSADDARESRRLELPGRSGPVWHGWIDGVRPGQLYGYRITGPGDGFPFSPRHVLFDPYARATGREARFHRSLLPDGATDGDEPTRHAALAAVLSGEFDWRGDRRPDRPWEDTILYEVHVRGFTRTHPGVPSELRGTFAGLASPAAIEHLTSLGVTAVELLPIQQHGPDRHTGELGLTNYWGYNTIGFFAPDLRLCADRSPEGSVREAKETVRTLHAAGIEVILDVVYNHTPEGDMRGPWLSLRGIDDGVYYRRNGEAERYVDFSGCGNTLDANHPVVVQLIVDSMRYWAAEVHVDGFRFDLASALARDSEGRFDPDAPLFRAVAADPLLSSLKLIAEPWDARLDGFNLGGFPPAWREWNASYRDGVRRFWRGEASAVPELATRMTGSSDIFARGGRNPTASVNFVTCHDGMTLTDLVRYDHKHNAANGEDNADGESCNYSWNSGVEGPTDDPAILERRRRRSAAMLATLFLSRGVPMLLGGDEIGRTQRGNNNAYCQDNELSWFDWSLRAGSDFRNLIRRLVAIRERYAAFRRPEFFHGGAEGQPRDVHWFAADGTEMHEGAWQVPPAPFLAALVEVAPDPPLLALFNANESVVLFPLPGNGRWEIVLDTAVPNRTTTGDLRSLNVAPWSVALLVSV